MDKEEDQKNLIGQYPDIPVGFDNHYEVVMYTKFFNDIDLPVNF